MSPQALLEEMPSKRRLRRLRHSVEIDRGRPEARNRRYLLTGERLIEAETNASATRSASQLRPKLYRPARSVLPARWSAPGCDGSQARYSPQGGFHNLVVVPTGVSSSSFIGI